MKAARSRPVRWLDRLGADWGALATLAAVSGLQLVLGGCATWQAPARADDAALRARAVSATAQDVTLTAAVLGSQDSRQWLGVDVNATGVQPVWVEVENRSTHTLWLLRAGTDPDYFSAREVAWSVHTPLAGAKNAAIDAHFDALSFTNPISPGSTRAGIIFTNPQARTRLLNVDLLGQRRMVPFTLFLPVPGELRFDQLREVVLGRTGAQPVEYGDPEALRAALERLPCCATGPNGVEAGDPINAVFVGEFADIAAALSRRGFRRDAAALDSDQRLFGREPDLVVRKAGQGGVPSQWMRAWLAPLRYRGQLVILVQAGRPYGGRFAAAEARAPMLHPDVDETRNLLIQDLLYSGGVARLGFVAGVGAAAPSQPRAGLAGTRYFTDGLRAVMFFATRPLAVSDIELLEWVPYLERRETGSVAK